MDLDADLVAEGVGIIDVRSVYDVDGATDRCDIAAVADPLQTTAAQRPARFLRIEKAVSIPDRDLVDLNNTAFGPNIQQGMREIVGYAPIEPDGSVRVKVPANVALAVSVLDADGRRITARHQNWLQVLPGEELKCNGCHSPAERLVARPQRLVRCRPTPARPARACAFPNTVASLSPDYRRDDGRDAHARKLPDRLRGARA